MEKVTIIFLAQESYNYAINSFEKLGVKLELEKSEIIIENQEPKYIKRIKAEIELIVINCTAENSIDTYFKNIADVILQSNKDNLASLYSECLRIAKNDLICIVESGLFVGEDWLINLIYNYTEIENSGVIGIAEDITEMEILPLINKRDDYCYIINAVTKTVENFIFFDKKRLYLVGGFDQSIDLYKNETNQFALRTHAIGFINYYISNQTCVSCNTKDYKQIEKYKQSQENLNKSIKEMQIAKNYYIPIDKIKA